jgi:4-amino-4-deoxy-L-arabinose transferase-like glycosyltransferase
MVAYTIYLSTHLLGHTAFAVRLPAVLLSLGTLVLVYVLAVRVFRSDRAALVSTLLLAAAPMINVGGTLMTIDVLFCFFSVLTMVCLWEALARERVLYWVLAGLAMSLAILSKFTAVLLIPGLFAFLILSRQARSTLKRPYPYICVALALSAFLPVLLWNASHNWVTFRHVAAQGEGNVAHFFNPKYFPEFIGMQMIVMCPPIFITMIAGMCTSIRRAWLGERSHLFLLCFAFPVLLFYLFLSFHRQIEANWPVVGYFPAMVAAGGIIVHKLGAWREQPWGRRMRVWMGICIITGVLVSLAGRFPPMLYAIGVSPLSLPTIRLQGWRELGAHVSRVVEEMGGPKNVFIFSESYQIAGEVAFYADGHPVTYCAPAWVNHRRLNQYDFWPGCDDLIGMDAVYVGKIRTEALSRVKGAFESVIEEPPPFEVRRSGKVIRSLTIVRLHKFRGFPKVQGGTTF